MEPAELIRRAEARCQEAFRRMEEIEYHNTEKVLDVMRRHAVSPRHFAPTTGYGYDDVGRDTLEAIYADLFHTEAAIVRPQIVSGTHTLSLAMFGVLRPGDELLYASGAPYDSLEEVIGLRGDGACSLKEMNVSYAGGNEGRQAGSAGHPGGHEAQHPHGGGAAQPGLFHPAQPDAGGRGAAGPDAARGVS